MTEPHFFCSPDFNPGQNFDREACRRHCPCEADFIGTLVANYQAEVRRKHLDKTQALLIAEKKGGEVCTIDIMHFHRNLRLLDANHLENVLCVFYPLEAFADFLEREKQKNNNHIIN